MLGATLSPWISWAMTVAASGANTEKAISHAAGHGHDPDPWLHHGMGIYFFALGLVNLYYTIQLFRRMPKPIIAERIEGEATGAYFFRALRKPILLAFWGLLTLFLLGSAGEHYAGMGRELPQSFRDFFDKVMNPVSYFILSCVAFALGLWFRKFFVKPLVAWIMLDASLIFIGLSMTDSDFRNIVAKPDNVPISMLIYSVGFTTWLAFYWAVRNDERIEAGLGPIEAEGSAKVLTWPDLVYTEMLTMILCSAFLIIWSICLRAPLEPPASATEIPNPSKAPWYFLGLQEMLVYFDPWLAGVVLPTYILIGLCAIPYIDYNKKGNGYYTFKERAFAITTFLFGFLVLWVVLIVLGTFLRGPNWNFFGFYEYWDPNKVLALNNINLSDILFIDVLKQAKPSFWLAREWPGIALILGYFAVTPLLLAKVLPNMYTKMGFFRFQTMTHILLMMALLPLKMLLRWVFNLKYIVYIPEYFFNI